MGFTAKDYSAILERGLRIGSLVAAIAFLNTACGETTFNSSSGKDRGTNSDATGKDKDGKDGKDGDDTKGKDGKDGDDTKGKDGNSTDSANSKDDIEIDEADQEILKALPKFAMLSNDFECGFCHLKIVGNMVSTKSVEPARGDSIATIAGDWLVDGSLNVTSKGAKVDITGSKKENYSGKEIPKGFPQIDFSDAKKLAKGTLEGKSESGDSVKISKKKSGNVVIIGTSSSPIEIDGDVVIDGDLIIKGPYKGVGTIYVTGNVFVPFDLVAKHSPFPYADSESSAKKEGEEAANDKKLDGLAIATKKSLFVGNVESSIIGDANAPINSRPEVNAMGGWFGMDKYRSLYEKASNCMTGQPTNDRSVNVIDAFIYAAKSIEGFAKASGFSIRGGIITDYFNVLNASNACVNSSTKNPVHGRTMNSSYIEYDWRLNTGKYRVLERLGDTLKD